LPGLLNADHRLHGRDAMIPIALDPAAVPTAVVGRGDAALRRFRALRAGKAHSVLLFSDMPDTVFAQTGGGYLRQGLPHRSDLAALGVLWIVGLPDDSAAELAALARSERVLVNVEDRPELCDFHSVAEVRRGDLLLTVSTGGASPGLAARIRARLAELYGPEWADRTAQIRRQREAWRGKPRAHGDVAALTDALLQANGWIA
jgi:precorrin-2 dehydrogenase / sirohydrochlorin ferrochelatase